jgi:hypothetical protein
MRGSKTFKLAWELFEDTVFGSALQRPPHTVEHSTPSSYNSLRRQLTRQRHRLPIHLTHAMRRSRLVYSILPLC